MSCGMNGAVELAREERALDLLLARRAVPMAAAAVMLR
jgi:hypothetical protein